MEWDPENELSGARVHNTVTPTEAVDTEYEDRMIYGRNYWDWTMAPKYRRQIITPDRYHPPVHRYELQFYKRKYPGAVTIVQKNPFYFRHVAPPTYYEMWGTTL
jgi:hypothetical protein